MASKAASDILSRWAQADPVAATAWMNSQNDRADRDSLDRDSLVSSMARAVGYSETEGAVKWAQTIHDPEQRQQTRDSVIRRSLRRDPAGAPAELAALGISQADIEQAQSRGGSVNFISRQGPDGSGAGFAFSGNSAERGTIALSAEPAPIGVPREVLQYENGAVKETVVFAAPGAAPATGATGGAGLSASASGGLRMRLVDNGVE